MSPSSQASKLRNWAQTFLAFTPIMAIAWFFIANGGDLGNFFEQGYSWVYLGTLIGFGIIIPLVPYPEALWADIASTVFLALIQLELAYITDWSGIGLLPGVILLKFGIPLTCLLVIGMLAARLQLWLQLPSERTNFEQDTFWTQRIGSAIGALVVLLCLTVLTTWIGLGGEVTEILGSTTYPSVFKFGVMLLSGFIASRIINQLLRKRREVSGYRSRSEPPKRIPRTHCARCN